MRNRVVVGVVLFLAAVVILNLMASSTWVISQGPSKSLLLFHAFLLSIWGVLLGAILEWRSILNVIRGNVGLNYFKLLPAVILLVIVFIPHVTWENWFEVTDPLDNIFLGWLFYPLQQLELNIVLSVVAGILIMRSFYPESMDNLD